jgi:sugar phosphate permease
MEKNEMISSSQTKRRPVYFGWYILAASVVLLSYQSVTFVYGFTAFITPIASTLGWTYAEISLATTIRGIQVGALDPFVGMVVDRWPARRLMILGTLTYALGVVILSKANSLLVFYLGFLVMGLGGTFCYSMVPQTVLARWFKKNIGKVSGILTMGFSIGGIFVPFIVKGIDAFGWQNLMLYLAFGVVILGLPMSLFFRNRPEEYGLLPDGAVPATDGAVTPAEEYVTGLKQILKMKAFWLIGIACMFHMIAVNALTIHIVPYMTSIGMDRETAALSITIFSLISLGVRLLYGILADKYPKKNIFALSSGITTAALVMLGLLNTSFALMVAFSVVYALGVAGSTALRVPITRDYFGAKNFGKIFGWLSVFSVVGGVAGAPLAGWVFDTRGTYSPIWYIFAVMTALATFLFLMLPPPGLARTPGMERGMSHA